MYQSTESATSLPRNYLQFHENAFVSPLNLINVTHPAPISFGRTPHVLHQVLPRTNPSHPSHPPSSSVIPTQLQSIDANKLQMYQFLAQRKLKEDRWKKELNDKNNVKPTISQRNARSAQQQQQQSQRPKNPSIRSASAPKKPVTIKRETPPPIHFTRPTEPYTSLSTTKQNEITDLHEQLLVQLRIVHNPPTRENVIDETEQEKQRRIRLKRERIKRDSRALYNAHQELKQILQDIRQPDVNFSRLIHHHLNAYKVLQTAAETLANEAPLKSHDTPIQQLFTSLVPILETLNHTNQALGLSQLHIDSSMLRTPPSKSVNRRTVVENRSSSSDHLLPAVYKELLKKKQRKPRLIPSVLRPRSAESVRLPRADSSTVSRSTISTQHKTRARSHSPLPSIRTPSTIETPFHSRFSVDHILVKLAPRLLANYTGRELAEQIERARTLIPMFLVDNRLTDDEIAGRVMQMIVPRQQLQTVLSTDKQNVFETPEERAHRINVDVYGTQISAWEDEMSQIRQRLQNYRTNRLEEETSARRTVRFQLDTPSTPVPLPENVEIHAPLFESIPVDLVSQSIETKPAFIQTSSHGAIRLQSLDANKIRQIERYRKDYQSYLNQTESAKSDDFDPCQIINRLSEYLLDESLLSVVNEIELLTVELSQKLVENELLGQEVTLADVEKQQRRPIQSSTRKRSPSPLNEQYNTSSFEEDLNSESRISRSEDDDNGFQRKNPMEGTGRFTTTAFEKQILPRRRTSSSSSSSSTQTPTPKGIIIKPTIVPTSKTNSIREEINQYSDGDFESSSSTRSKTRLTPNRNNDDDDDEDDNVLISMKTGEKIYSTDFEESKSKHRNVSDDDEDDADTIKLSARSSNIHQHSSFYSDEDD